MKRNNLKYIKTFVLYCFRFSFQMAANGQVLRVYCVHDEDQDVVMIKKGLVSVLSANFQHAKQTDKV